LALRLRSGALSLWQEPTWDSVDTCEQTVGQNGLAWPLDTAGSTRPVFTLSPSELGACQPHGLGPPGAVKRP
jgi:hypothetical protein